MGQAIKTIMYSYDPEAIVIGGSLSKAFRFFEPQMVASLRDFTFPQSSKKLKTFQSVNENIPLLGAAAMVPLKTAVEWAGTVALCTISRLKSVSYLAHFLTI
jgi:predicted NBD/HSP70 family sugar kinase